MRMAPNVLQQRSRWLALLIWLAILAVPGICPAASDERALLWKIESPGASPSYLFGTIHTDDDRVTQFSPELGNAMKQARVYLMEVLPPGNPSVYYLPQGSLRDLLQPAEIEQVQLLADQHAMQEEIALRMKPWLLAMVFALPRPSSPWSQDILLWQMAQGQGLEILGLEEATVHFSLLDGLAMDEQLTLLRSVLAMPQLEKEQSYDAVVQAYVDRDLAQIVAENEKWTGTGLPEALWAKVKPLLLDQRNERMARRIAQLAAQGPVFVSVGAAHLPGEGGLVDRLRKAGYTLTPIQ